MRISVNVAVVRAGGASAARITAAKATTTSKSQIQIFRISRLLIDMKSTSAYATYYKLCDEECQTDRPRLTPQMHHELRCAVAKPATWP
jgi:hypothetical protein